MAQVLVAAWVGVTVGWIGFGWVLAEAPGEGGRIVAAQDAVTYGFQEPVQVGFTTELNRRG